MFFSFRLFAEKKVAWILFFVNFSKSYGISVKKNHFLHLDAVGAEGTGFVPSNSSATRQGGFL